MKVYYLNFKFILFFTKLYGHINCLHLSLCRVLEGEKCLEVPIGWLELLAIFSHDEFYVFRIEIARFNTEALNYYASCREKYDCEHEGE